MKHSVSKLSVLTFNAWGLKVGSLSIAKSVDQRIKRIAMEINSLHPDVVAMQEVWTDTSAQYLMNNLNYNYFSYHPDRKTIKGGLGNGLIFFSRYPIVEEHQMTYSKHTEWYEFFANKGALMIKIETPSGYVQLFNTHLGSGKLPAHSVNRIKQIQELKRYIQKFSFRYPSLLVGDLNLNPEMREYERLRAWMRDTFSDKCEDTYAAVHPDSDGITFYKNRSYKKPSSLHDRDERIDYIFLLRAKENRMYIDPVHSDVVLNNPSNPLSDHCGVLTSFELCKKKTVSDFIPSLKNEFKKIEVMRAE